MRYMRKQVFDDLGPNSVRAPAVHQALFQVYSGFHSFNQQRRHCPPWPGHPGSLGLWDPGSLLGLFLTGTFPWKIQCDASTKHRFPIISLLQ